MKTILLNGRNTEYWTPNTRPSMMSIQFRLQVQKVSNIDAIHQWYVDCYYHDEQWHTMA